LPAIIVVLVVAVVIAIVVIANPPCSAITIADTIAIAAPGWHIAGRAIATALLFHGGVSAKVERPGEFYGSGEGVVHTSNLLLITHHIISKDYLSLTQGHWG
jgi:hypothetical protein